MIGHIFQATYLIVLIDLIILSMFVFEMFVLQLGIMCYIIPFIYHLYIISRNYDAQSIIIIRSLNISKTSKYINVGCSFWVQILRMYKIQWRHFLFGLIKASFDLYTSWVIRRCQLQFGRANECIRRLKRFTLRVIGSKILTDVRTRKPKKKRKISQDEIS